MRRVPLLLSAALLLLTGEMGLWSAAYGRGSAPPVNARAWRGAGALAFVWHRQLWVLNGRTGRLSRLPSSGAVSDPRWSPDGRWLATSRAGGPDLQGVWLSHPDGTLARAVSSLANAQFAWSPTSDTLAVASVEAGISSSIVLVRPGRTPYTLARHVEVDSFAWSPDGRRIAFTGAMGPQRLHGVVPEAVYVVDVRTGRIRSYPVRPHAHYDLLLVAGWWPNARGILYWVDPGASGSARADGLPLWSLDTSSGQTRRLASTLTYGDWFAPAPRGDRILVVEGRWRAEYYNKQVALCDERTLACRPLPHPRGTVTVDPSWSPGGRIAYVQARDLPNTDGFRTDAGLLRWIGSRSMRLTASPSSAGLRPAGMTGIWDPLWSANGRELLFIRANALWLQHLPAGRPLRIAPLFDTARLPSYPGPYWDLFYYGHIDWRALFSWSSL